MERKARLILDSSVFRAVDQTFHSMASTREGEEGINQMTICFPDLSDVLLSAVRSRLAVPWGLLAVEDGGGRAALVRGW